MNPEHHPERESNPNGSLEPEALYADNRDRSVRYKGVVPQQNGHWGAQIYANQKRIWLGTFKTETDAAMAYDSAAIRLRSGDPYRNICSSPQRMVLEAEFQSQFSIADLLNMIKDGSYQRSLAEFGTTRQLLRHHQERIGGGAGGSCNQGERISCIMMFQKEVTPSDVGKLNRLVIPKKFALTYLPLLGEVKEGKVIEEDQETELSFFDRKFKCWKFRYCYWKSSQSFVFTRGWNKFVKENNLKAKDSVVFSLCQERGQARSFLTIDVRLRHENEERIHSGDFIQHQVSQEEMNGIHITQTSGNSTQHQHHQVGQEEEVEGKAKGKGIRLFGVDIPC